MRDHRRVRLVGADRDRVQRQLGSRARDLRDGITPAMRQLQAIGGGRHIPGRAAPATISIVLSSAVLIRVATAQPNNELSIVTEDGAIYQLIDSVVSGSVLRAALELLGVAPSPG